ncbi:prolyl aminopeptidase [Endozoicomonas ascidiicola]|uniref:prolyl aminopeptidase n=1 Tax=Endozoicomonas ascidiicola TaxID=1698521 RepID=UPI000835417F|nr:prolyl aminopeptidase [Endozoicomonas ascidiicola]
MRTLYPAIKPYATHHLQVDDIHELYIEECGSQDGIPVLFVHGGPGAGCTDKSRCFFDPEKYRIILFDQRGCGQSKPHAELKQNETSLLIEDIEKIREMLSIEQWLLFGGSWGSTLSLLYAQAHPKRVSGLILRGVFLSRQQDFDWLYKEGASRMFPDHWAHFLELIPEAEQGDLLEAYYQRLFGDDELARMNAAKHWSLWEGNIATLRPNHELVDHFSEPHLALSLSRIECHYFRNHSFIDAGQILENMGLIASIPGVIIHGRYDMICPLDNAQALADHWPKADLQIVRDAGHASCEPGITDALVRATDDFARRLSS